MKFLTQKGLGQDYEEAEKIRKCCIVWFEIVAIKPTFIYARGLGCPPRLDPTRNDYECVLGDMNIVFSSGKAFNVGDFVKVLCAETPMVNRKSFKVFDEVMNEEPAERYLEKFTCSKEEVREKYGIL